MNFTIVEAPIPSRSHQDQTRAPSDSSSPKATIKRTAHAHVHTHSGVLYAFGLVDYGLHHIRVAVPAAHRCNPSYSVQIPLLVLVEQVLPLPVHYVQGFVVQAKHGGAEILLALGQDLVSAKPTRPTSPSIEPTKPNPSCTHPIPIAILPKPHSLSNPNKAAHQLPP
ncbi:hypothetical protein ACFX2B_023420 [Malus domestica]